MEREESFQYQTPVPPGAPWTWCHGWTRVMSVHPCPMTFQPLDLKMPAMASKITKIFVDRWSRPSVSSSECDLYTRKWRVIVSFKLLSMTPVEKCSVKMSKIDLEKDKVPSFLAEQKSRRRFVWPFVNDFRTENVAGLDWTHLLTTQWLNPFRTTRTMQFK